MNTNIFVPSKINVGFQNRKGTYTGKLAYVIYFDEKGKLRKEPSWNNWRDKEIPNEIYYNEPTEGFVLNKKVGGVEESWGWDARKTYTRVYDPRGFEFEITIPNLLWILENCNCIKGKGLEGQFVYGWDGKDLVLVPTESPDYKEIEAKSAIRHNDEFVKAKELIVGATYETLKGEKYVYMGKHDVYETLTNRYHDYSWYRNRKPEWDYPLDDGWMYDSICRYSVNYGYMYKHKNIGKQFWFIKLGDPNSTYYNEDAATYFKSVTRKFCNVINTECDNYQEFYEIMQKNASFSPIDYNENKILPVSLDDFSKGITGWLNNNPWYTYVYHLNDGKLVEITVRYNKSENEFYYESNGVKVCVDSIEELYDKLQPMYGEQYLENGKLYRRVGYYPCR